MKNLIALLLLTALISGCSVKFEIGYHGKSGTDSQIATPELVAMKNRWLKQ